MSAVVTLQHLVTDFCLIGINGECVVRRVMALLVLLLPET